MIWKHEQFVPYRVVVDSVNSFRQPKKVIAGTGEFIKSLDAGNLDRNASSLIYNGTSVSELAQKLSQIVLTDAEKARAIYVWIANHIDYDVEMFYSGQYRFVKPEEFLKTRQAICSGYAILYQALAKEMGLQSEIIPGTVKGVSYAVGQNDENHAWNAVKIDNAWYLVDVTCGGEQGLFKIDLNANLTLIISPHYPNNLFTIIFPLTLLDNCSKLVRQNSGLRHYLKSNRNFFSLGYRW